MRRPSKGRSAPVRGRSRGLGPGRPALPRTAATSRRWAPARFDPDSPGEQPNRVTDWGCACSAPAPRPTVAIGTCATWGGIPAAAGNVTGSMSLMDFLGKDYRSALGVPVVNIPGCSPVGDNFTETVAAVLMFLQGIGPLPEFDELGRPAWLFEETVHRHCVRAGYYEEGVFAHQEGDKECLVDIGCWGPGRAVQHHRARRDQPHGRLHGRRRAPASAARCRASPTSSRPSTRRRRARRLHGDARTYGAAIRRLRRVTMRQPQPRAAVGPDGDTRAPTRERLEAEPRREGRGLLLQEAPVQRLGRPGEALPRPARAESATSSRARTGPRGARPDHLDEQQPRGRDRGGLTRPCASRTFRSSSTRAGNARLKEGIRTRTPTR